MSVQIAVELFDGGPFGPGDVVRGGVRVVEGGSARTVTVSLQYRERSPSYRHTAVEVPGPVLHTGDLEAGMWFEFSLQMPADALPEQILRHGEIYWQVDAKVDRRGSDVHAEVRLGTGSPGGGAGGGPAPERSAAAATRGSRGGVAVAATVIATTVAIAFGGWRLAEAVSGAGEGSTGSSVPVYTPPVGSPAGRPATLWECFDRAGTNADARLVCIREYNRAVTEPGSPSFP